jgi:hypothetical protein
MTLHAHTPTLAVTEPRGLVVRSVAWHQTHIAGSLLARVNRSAFDEAGRIVQQWDARLWAWAWAEASATGTPNLTGMYSLSGQLLRSDSVDAGWRTRHAHEAAFERTEQRMQAHPEMMVARRSIVEHPFGNLKQWIMGTGRFLLKQLKGAQTEMALAVLAHNFKRVINILGAREMMAAMG